MPNCSNCSKPEGKYILCDNCFNNIFKKLFCDGHCGRFCDPSLRANTNIISLPWYWFCETCRKKRENPNLPPLKKDIIKEDIESLKGELNSLKIKQKEWSEKMSTPLLL